MQDKKTSVQDNDYLVIAAFSENYSFVVQEEIQLFHWNNGSANVHSLKTTLQVFATL